jgi:hypothetical protein
MPQFKLNEFSKAAMLPNYLLILPANTKGIRDSRKAIPTRDCLTTLCMRSLAIVKDTQ